VGGQCHAPVAYPWERQGTHCIGGWVGPSVGLDRCRNLTPTGIWFLDSPACRIIIPIALSQPTCYLQYHFKTLQ